MSGYIVFHYNVLDADRIDELGPRSLPILERYGGELVAGSVVKPLEGAPFTHMVVYRFADEATAMAYYGCDEMQELSKLRRQITEGFAVYVPELAGAGRVGDDLVEHGAEMDVGPLDRGAGGAGTGRVPISDELASEIDGRLARYRADPNTSRSAEEVRRSGYAAAGGE